MQRAQEKQKRVEDTIVAEKKEGEAHWVVEGSRTRCIVLAEGDPYSSTLGRVSFKGFNPETERLQQEAEQREARRAAAAAAADPEGKSVSDEAMAAELGRRQQQQQQQSQVSHATQYQPGLGKQQQQQQQHKQQKQLHDEQIVPLRALKKQRR
ncbi:hypothetical protein N2152v2_003045 [Parachlorella kessleri]